MRAGSRFAGSSGRRRTSYCASRERSNSTRVWSRVIWYRTPVTCTFSPASKTLPAPTGRASSVAVESPAEIRSPSAPRADEERSESFRLACARALLSATSASATKISKANLANFIIQPVSDRSLLGLLRQPMKRIHGLDGRHRGDVEVHQLFAQAVVGNAEKAHLRRPFGASRFGL